MSDQTDPLDVLGYEHGLEVVEHQKGWLVITGKEGDTFNPAAFFFSKERAEQYCRLTVDDGEGGEEDVAFDSCAIEAVLFRDRIIAANDFELDTHEKLLDHIASTLADIERKAKASKVK